MPCSSPTLAKDTPLSGPLRGFTLVELLATVAIVGLMIALLLPAVQMARESARRMSCANNLRQWALAMNLHHHSMQAFPYHCQRRNNPETNTSPDSFGSTQRRTWVVSIWPFIDQLALYNSWNFDDNYFGTTPVASGGQPNDSLIQVKVPAYYCPSDAPGSRYGYPGSPMTNWGNLGARGNYVVNVGQTRAYVSSGPIGPFGYKNRASFGATVPFRTTVARILDGTSSTLLMSELRIPPGEVDDQRGTMFLDPTGGWFTAAAPPNSGTDRLQWSHINICDNSIFPCTATSDSSDQLQIIARSRHPGGVNAAFCDSSVHFIPDSIDPGVWQELSTINSRQPVGAW